jgi:hypothetical protein
MSEVKDCQTCRFCPDFKGFWMRHCHVPAPDNLPAVYFRHPIEPVRDKQAGTTQYFTGGLKIEDCPAWQAKGGQ